MTFGANTYGRRRRRILSIAHSYVVALNRRLAHELSRAGKDGWEVTAVAPAYFHGSRDLRPVTLEHIAGEPCTLVASKAYLTSRVHVFFYGSALRRELAQRWDLVHCWEEPFTVAGFQVAWWTPPSSALVYATFQNLHKWYPPPFSLFEQYSLRRASGWVAFGQTIDQQLKDRPLYRDRLKRVISIGVDTDLFRPDSERGTRTLQALGWQRNGPPVVGYLGRFVPEKGLNLITRALDRIDSPWRAIFVGSGPLESRLRLWATRHTGRVLVCTGVHHSDVPRYLNAMDLLCAPSQTTHRWSEQFGRMLIEGFASGVPIVGSDSGEIPHVIGDAGLVIGEADEDSWVEKLTILLNSPARRGDLAAKGLERAHRLFAWPVVARQHLDFFDEILESRKS